MSTEQNLKILTLPAGADLSAKQYCGVYIYTDGTVKAVASEGAIAHGILQNDPDASGKAASVATSGISKMVLGDTMATIGVKVQVDEDGKGMAASSGDYVIGTNLDAGVAGDVIRVLLNPSLIPLA